MISGGQAFVAWPPFLLAHGQEAAGKTRPTVPSSGLCAGCWSLQSKGAFAGYHRVPHPSLRDERATRGYPLRACGAMSGSPGRSSRPVFARGTSCLVIKPCRRTEYNSGKILLYFTCRAIFSGVYVRVLFGSRPLRFAALGGRSRLSVHPKTRPKTTHEFSGEFGNAAGNLERRRNGIPLHR